MICVKAKLTLGKLARLNCVIPSLKFAQVPHFPVKPDVCHPPLFAFIERHPHMAAGICRIETLIALVFRARDFSKVGDPVVLAVSIDVINKHRPSSVADGKGNTMRQILSVEDGPGEVSCGMNRSKCALASPVSVPLGALVRGSVAKLAEIFWPANAPVQFPRFRVIMQELT